MQFGTRKTIVAAALVAIAFAASSSPTTAAVYRDYTTPAYRLKYGYSCDYTPPYCGFRRGYFGGNPNYFYGYSSRRMRARATP
jgi:hypothetical protein